jgi:hypothetical protein
VTYSPRAEELIRRRRASLRQRGEASFDTVRTSAAPPLDRIARDGIAALERLGAELEAAFAKVPASGPVPAAPTAPSVRAAAGDRDVMRAERAALDVEIERQLLDEGIVVRGHDVARVVGLMIGRSVEWEE